MYRDGLVNIYIFYIHTTNLKIKSRPNFIYSAALTNINFLVTPQFLYKILSIAVYYNTWQNTVEGVFHLFLLIFYMTCHLKSTFW